MPQTPNSSAAAHLSVAEFLKRVDQRVVAQLVSDAADPVSVGSLTTNANLLAALDDAAGEIESTAGVGRKYSAGDLAALTGVGQKFLFRIEAILTFNYLVARRLDFNVKPHPLTEWAESMLEKLRQGERVFGLQEAQDATVLDHVQATAAEIEQRGSIVIDAQRYFGRRFTRNH